MPDSKARVQPAETEAAAWHARLGEPRVSAETIEGFFVWRQKPENAEAYRRVETAWTETGRLKADPDMAAAVEAAMSRRTASAGRGLDRRVLGTAVVCAALVLGAGLVYALKDRNSFATAVGETRVVQLADGSSVRMDTGSRLLVRYSGDRRHIELQEGQAFFTVAHDAARPFVVSAGEAEVTAVGTVFDVRRDAGAVRVTLVSGAVDVRGQAAGEVRRLERGQEALVAGPRIIARAADVAAATGWTEGRIVLRETSLKQAVAEVNRYLTAGIELDAPLLEDETVSGVFKTGDRDAFVSAAAASLGLKVSDGRDGRVRLTAEK